MANSVKAAVLVWSDRRLKMINSTIRHSAGYGFYEPHSNGELTLKDNIITSSKVPMLLNPDYPTIVSGGIYTGNETDAIVVVDDAITGQHNWTNLGVPYRIANRVVVAAAGGELTIQPGVALEFEDDGELHVNEGASGAAPSLIAVGTDQASITFTAVNKILGAWKGIYFDTPSPLNEIGFATISYAGNSRREGAAYTWAGAVVSMHDISFGDIQRCAIYAGATNPNPNLSTLNLSYSKCY